MSEFGFPATFGEGGRPAHQVFEPGPGVIEVNGLLGPEGAVGHFSGYVGVGRPAGADSQAIFFTPGSPLPLGVVGAIHSQADDILRQQAAYNAARWNARAQASRSAGIDSTTMAMLLLL